MLHAYTSRLLSKCLRTKALSRPDGVATRVVIVVKISQGMVVIENVLGESDRRMVAVKYTGKK